jgi:transcriptional regulator with GAF, ATPase, and Fis domain/tetratricopeptide (TPR) repeat protein
MIEKTILNFLNELNEDEREAIEIAALVGTHFFLDHILDLSTLKPSKLLEILDRMIHLNFVQNDLTRGRGAFSFKPEKLSDVIIDSMKNDRKEFYLPKIIGYMERELAHDDKKPLILAELFLKFKNNKNYFRYTKQAADLFASAHKTESALELYKRIIDSFLVDIKGDPLDNLILVDSVISYSRIAVNVRPPDELLPLLKKTLSIAKQLKNNKALSMLEVCIGRLYQSKGWNIKAAKHYKKGGSIAEKTKDKNLIRTISKISALSLFWQGKIDDAVQVYEQTLESLEEISPDSQDFWAYLMLSYCYGISGRVGRGLGLAEALKEQAFSKKNFKNQAFSEAVIALILLEIRQVEKAVPHIDSALEIGKKLGSSTVSWMVKPCKAYVLYKKRDLIGAKAMLESGISHAKRLGLVHYPSPWILDILWSLHKAKLEPIQGYSFTSEMKRLKKWPDIYMKGSALRYEAVDIRMFNCDSVKAKALLKKSHELLKNAGAKIELGRTQVELAKFFISQKENSPAKQFANMAYLTLTEIDSHLFPSELLFLVQDKPQKNRMFKGISELSNAVDSFQDTDSYLGKVVTILTDMFGAERAAILLRENGNPNAPLHIAATRSFSPEELTQFDGEPLQTLILSAFEKKNPLIINGPEKNINFPKPDTNIFSVRSLACIPLVIHGLNIGLIYIDNRLLEGIFSDKDFVIMTAIATQVALYLKATTYHRELSLSKVHSKNLPSYLENNGSDKEFPQILGKSKAIKSALIKIKKVAITDATVLILGETGVGKELMAQAIHQKSHRADKPFITINISALSESLLPSELFGYEKGAFTGADKAKAGRFEMAHNGTIFLDEIGDLSTEAQVKLLRVLQEGEFERVGGNQTIHSDFRLIAATNRNLSNMVAMGDFRSDLFYRIGTFPIEILPLRERKEDIPILASYFLQKYATKHRKSVLTIPKYEIEKLLEYSWPGNIRELEHIIERSLILSESSELLIPNFEITSISSEKKTNRTELLPLDEISRRHIIKVLNHTKWRVRGEKGAAKILELKPTTLEYRIKKLGIKK